MRSLETELVTRKPSFQGPRIVIKVTGLSWDINQGVIKGFEATEEAPLLQNPSEIDGDGQLEAKSMMGTDESV